MPLTPYTGTEDWPLPLDRGIWIALRADANSWTRAYRPATVVEYHYEQQKAFPSIAEAVRGNSLAHAQTRSDVTLQIHPEQSVMFRDDTTSGRDAMKRTFLAKPAIAKPGSHIQAARDGVEYRGKWVYGYKIVTADYPVETFHFHHFEIDGSPDPDHNAITKQVRVQLEKHGFGAKWGTGVFETATIDAGVAAPTALALILDEIYGSGSRQGQFWSGILGVPAALATGYVGSRQFYRAWNERHVASTRTATVLNATAALNLSAAMSGLVSSIAVVAAPDEALIAKLFGGWSLGSYTLAQLIEGLNAFATIFAWLASSSSDAPTPTVEIATAAKTLFTIFGATTLTVGQAVTLSLAVTGTAVAAQGIGTVVGGVAIHYTKRAKQKVD